MKKKKLVRVSIERAVKFLLADDSYRKCVYLIQNRQTKHRFYTTGKECGMAVCCCDRAQCQPETLELFGFKAAFIRMEDLTR